MFIWSLKKRDEEFLTGEYRTIFLCDFTFSMSADNINSIQNGDIIISLGLPVRS